MNLLENLSKAIQFGEQLSNDLQSARQWEPHEKIILALYRKLIEQLDGNFSVADQNQKSPALVMARASFETYLGLKYILEKKRRIEDRAHCYYVGFLKSQHKIVVEQLADPKPFLSQGRAEFTKGETERLLNTAKFKRIAEEWERTRRKDRNGYEPKWYSLFNGPRSLKQLVEKVGDERDYLLYGLLSKEVHGYQAINVLQNMDVTAGEFSFKPLRGGTEGDFQEELMRALCTSSTFRIIESLCPERKKDFKSFIREIGLLPKSFSYQLKV